MQRYTYVSSDWRNWLAEGLRRGCDPQEMLSVMVQKHFDERVAATVLSEINTALASNQTVGVAATTNTAYVQDIVRLPECNTIRTPDRDVRVLMRIGRPLIAVLDNVLDDDECEAIKALAIPRLKRSSVIDPETGGNLVMDARTSSGMCFMRAENELIARLDQRTAAIMHWPESSGEGLQVLRYTPSGEYEPHYDYFRIEDKGSERHFRLGGQRVSTLIMYLNDVEEGGATIFPNINFSYIPRKGQALYFEYCNSAGAVDPLSLHGGAPVKRGEKWIVTKWMRQGRYGY
jgi:prolyl 4-hydroxylase